MPQPMPPPPQQQQENQGQPAQDGQESASQFQSILQQTFKNLLDIKSIVNVPGAPAGVGEAADAAIQALQMMVDAINGKGGQQRQGPSDVMQGQGQQAM